jgi:hypothetical protein
MFRSRREVLKEAALGFGGLALNAMIGEAAGLSPRQPHFAPRAKRVILLYIGGGPSTIDMFDPKPVLRRFDGKPAPFEIKGRALNGSQQIMASPWEFTRCGASGREISNLLPHWQKVIDKVTFIRSMTTDRIDHSTAQFTFVTGRGFTGFPAIGSWVSYALGTENQNLPAYIALGEGASIGARAHSSAWLPPVYSGTAMRADARAPIYNISRPEGMSGEKQQRLISAIQQLNREQKADRPLDQDLEARIANYELAARMQLAATSVADLSRETEATRTLYGVDNPISGGYGRLCLMARRLVESGVRFVQVYGGGGGNWDTHSNIKGQLPGLCQYIDQGTAALLTDLDQRGLLEDTLVVWSGEFGRLPTIEANTATPGRDHNPYGFGMWMAGGGVKRGYDFGATDELGYAALADQRAGHSDIHATIQHLLGIDFQKNTYPYEGRNESLVGINPARVIREVLI